MKRLSSLRTTLAPMPSTPIVFPPYRSLPCRQFHRSAAIDVSERKLRGLFGGLRHLHAAGRIEHGLDDVVIAGAATDVAFEFRADGGFVELAARSLSIMASYDVDRRHDHARGAVTALQAVIVAERRLHRMQLVALGDAFDGGDVRVRGLSGQHRAGFHRAAVDMDDASTALAGVATDVSAGQVQIVAQEMHEQGAVLDVDR